MGAFFVTSTFLYCYCDGVCSVDWYTFLPTSQSVVTVVSVHFANTQSKPTVQTLKSFFSGNPFGSRMARLGLTRALAVVIVTVTRRQLSCSRVTPRLVSVSVSPESMDPTADSVLLDTGTMDRMDVGVGDPRIFLHLFIHISTTDLSSERIKSTHCSSVYHLKSATVEEVAVTPAQESAAVLTG